MEHLMNARSVANALTMCPNCSSGNVSRTEETDVFTYGSGESTVELSVRVPVFHCKECEFAFTDEAASELRHDAICHHLGVMTPKQIRSVRGHLSQAEFASLSQIGKASVARWESGALIQNLANDSYLYLLSFPDNLMRLREKRNFAERGISSDFGRFRALSSSDAVRLRGEAQGFELFICPEAAPCTQ